jgi:hypothetical protein
VVEAKVPALAELAGLEPCAAVDEWGPGCIQDASVEEWPERRVKGPGGFCCCCWERRKWQGAA